ncbi:MAG: J domain-containing protein [Kofleriaceae bacterium]
MSWPLARRALGLPPSTGDAAEAGRIVAAARTVELDIPRASLRWHAGHYATDLGGIAALREARALTVPEVEFARHLDGTLPVLSIARRGPTDGPAAPRLLWALASVGAIALSPEPRDAATPARRALVAARYHLRGRMARLERSTFFDVLEVTPAAEEDEIQRAYEQLAARYAPNVLGAYDLADLTDKVAPVWELVEKARAVLIDIAARGRYLDWLRAKLPELRTVWAIDATPARQAADAFARGQRYLGEGDPHRAMSDLAAACRQHPGHPEYETNLAWARYRVEVGAGKDRAATARTERQRVEHLLAGVRPWPRALLAQALLCAADGDSDAARWHLRDALSVDPNLPAAQQLLARLGGR